MLGSSIINAVASLLSLLAGFGSSVVVARLLGADGTGAVAYALWIMTSATLLADMGIPQALLRFVGRDGQDRASLIMALTRRFSVSTALLALVIIVVAAYFYATGAAGIAMTWIATAGLYIAYAYSTLALGIEQGLGNFRKASARTAIGCLIQPFSVALGAFFFGPAGAIAGHVLRHLPQALALRLYFGRREETNPQPIPDIVKTYSRNNWLAGGLSSLLASRIEFSIIGFYFSVNLVGQYATGATMAGMIIQLSFALVTVLVPLFASHRDRGDSMGLNRSYRLSMWGMTFLMAPICFGGGAVAPVLVPMLFGQGFQPAGELAAVLLPFTVAQVLTTVSYRMMLAHECSKAVLQFSLWEGFLGIIALMIAIPLFGATGAVWTKGLIAAASALLHIGYCWKKLDVPLHPLPIMKIFVSAALCAGAAALVLEWNSGILGLALAILA
ncbi:MAG: oligosaccharide flippase family protein, partial [Rhizobiaceae bacterium]|nr:oligosaccharide flippase family protein [Rhizobiaceae bacterium]